MRTSCRIAATASSTPSANRVERSSNPAASGVPARICRNTLVFVVVRLRLGLGFRLRLGLRLVLGVLGLRVVALVLVVRRVGRGQLLVRRLVGVVFLDLRLLRIVAIEIGL